MKRSLPTVVAGTVFLGVLLLAREYNTAKTLNPNVALLRPAWPQMTTLQYQKPFVPVIEQELRPAVVLNFENPFLAADRARAPSKERVVWSGSTYMTGVLAVLALFVVIVGLRRKPQAVVRGGRDDHTGINMMQHVLQATERRRRF